MAQMAAVNAGVSLIGGIAGISAKNKAARAQREQLNAQSKAQAAQSMSNEAILASQQQLAQSQYNNSVLSRFAQFQQADFGLQAQKQLAAIKAQEQAYQIQSGQLQQMSQAQSASDQLQRQATGVQISANQQRQAADAETANLGEQSAAQLAEMSNALTAAERKRLSMESGGRIQSDSNRIASDRDLQDRIASALSMGLEMDRNQVAQAMQSFNAQDLADIGERLGLLDNAASADSIAANLRLLKLSADASLQQNDFNQQNTNASIDFARQQGGIMSQLDAQNAAEAYRQQDFALGTQRAVNTGQQAYTQQANAAAYNNIRGASFMDWLTVGSQAAGAASPLLYNRPQAQAPFGFNVNSASGFGSSGFVEPANRTDLLPDISGGFGGGTTQLRGF